MRLIQYSILLFILILVTYGLQCNICEDEFFDYTEVSVFIKDSKASYSVGDTIGIYCSFPSDINLIESGTTLDISNKQFRMDMYFNELVIGQRETIGSVDKLEFITRKGQVQKVLDLTTLRKLLYGNCDDEDCVLEFDIIFREPGMFSIALGFGVFLLEEDCRSIDMRPLGFETVDLNLGLLEKLEAQGYFIRNRFIEADRLNDKRVFIYEVTQ